MSQKADTFEIILGRVEHINASHFNCLSFSKASDMVNGINLRLSNMAGGYPFSFGGVTWRDSETLYLCGEFSDSSEKHLLVQEDMQRQTSGFAAKRFIKKRNSNLIRQDFADFRIQWMLYVVWQKCMGNADFANLLLKLPQDAIIIEDTTKQHADTKEIWGCTNTELTARRTEVKKETIKQAKANYPNIFTGQNNLGKILMICRECLIYGTEPPIDYTLLDSMRIYILEKRLSFQTAKTSISN